jgi:formylglycine-generating enzyme required for sulfatase activity
MKKISIAITLLSITLFSFISSQPASKKLKKILGNTWAYVPSGEVKIAEKLQNVGGFYISKTEISNGDYVAFLTSMKEKNPVQYTNALPDTTVWNFNDNANNGFTKQYLRYPGFKTYPVVGVSFEAAQLYCKWLEESINAQMEENQKVIVKLPSELEWIRAARGDNHESIFPWEGTNLQNEKGKSMANYKKEKIEDFKAVIITSEVKSFYPNQFGIYQMSGNVAEMTNEPKKVKGGGWDMLAKSLKIDESDNINYPAKNVGFRPILMVVTK